MVLVFPTFFNLSLNLAIKSSWSEPQSAPSLVFADCIRASPSLAAKNIINLILVLTIWWCPCVEYSPVLLEEGVCYDQCVLLAKLLAFALIHFVLQGQTCLLLQVSLDFILLHSSRLWWKGLFFFLVLVLKGLIGLHRTVQLQLLQHYWLGHRLRLLWYWMVCLQMNRDHSVDFEIAISTVFQTLLLIGMATPFLLRDSCPQ